MSLVQGFDGIDPNTPFHLPSQLENIKAQVSPRGKILTAAYKISPQEHGYTYWLNSATEFLVTLPPLKHADPGWYCDVIVHAAPSGANYQITEDGNYDTNKVISLISELEINTGQDGPSSLSGHTFINFIGGTSTKGDRVHIVSNGLNWFAYGLVAADGAITLT